MMMRSPEYTVSNNVTMLDCHTMIVCILVELDL